LEAKALATEPLGVSHTARRVTFGCVTWVKEIWFEKEGM